MNERLWILISAAFAFASTVWTFLPHRPQFHTRRGAQILLGFTFVALTLFLLKRGEVIHRCPLTNGFEATAFLTWGLIFTYFLIGTSFRLSILGAFTAPLSLFLLTLGWFFTKDTHPLLSEPAHWQSEFHAAISVLSYGTLGLASICGGMYLVQEHHLKTHDFSGWFNRLPSMGDLDSVLHRLLRWGFVLMTLGIISGFSTGLFEQVSKIKIIWAWLVWFWYLILLAVPRLFRLSHRRFAWASLLGYILVLLSFWIMNYLLGKN
ncbi:MAG: cytochrome c biogenesis protein CcsA [Verrucomicrobiota bacterium]